MPIKTVREMTHRERRRHSLSSKTFRSLLLVCAALSLAAIVFGYLFFNASVNREYRTRTCQLSKTAANLVEKRAMRKEAEALLSVYTQTPEEERDKLCETRFPYEQQADFGEAKRILTDIRQEGNAIAAYIAALDVENSRMIMILDSDETDSYCPPGTLFSYLPGQIHDFIYGNASGMFDRFYGVDPMPSIIYRPENYGYRCTAGTQLFEVGGYPVFAFVDTDMNVAARVGRIFLLQYFGLLFTLAIIAALLAMRHMKKTVVEPINQMAQAAEAYTKDRVDEHRTDEHFGKVQISTGDEIENLSLAMKDMEQELGEYVQSLTRVTAEKERIGAELDIASKIQIGMLPSTFPAFPERKEFDIYAAMHTAKEVGGDFYDYFMIDDDHIAVVMADVSGKGVPAALFMMASKILIKNNAGVVRTSPALILEKVNHQICQNNTGELFVTAWLGILEISTGLLKAANAGHEYPVVKRRDGSFQLFKDLHGFVLGGVDGMRYREYEMVFSPGDILFLYTDGVNEATNAQNEMFGTGRMLRSLESVKDITPENLLKTVNQDVMEFVGDAPQFDDITMLCLEYLGPSAKKITIEANSDLLPQVLAFIDRELEAADCPIKAQMQIDIAVEEIFVNIASYAYAPGTGDAVIGIQVQDDVAEITFSDSGIPYNPVIKKDPDITLSAEERDVGGLGIFMVKKTMDSLEYTYRDGQNLLTMRKKLH